MVAALLGVCLVFSGCFWREYERKDCLYYSLLAVLALSMIWLYWIRAYRQNRLSYDNGEHPRRFWAAVGIGLLAAFGMCFLPFGLWPAPAMYLLLTLFGSLNLGIMGGTVLLLIPGLICQISMEQFLMQFVAGFFTALAFQRYDGETKFRKPAVRSLIGIAFCLALPVLYRGQGDEGLWMQAFQNLLLTSVLGCTILFSFDRAVLYRRRKIFSRLLDTEGELLTEYRKNFGMDYQKCVHVVYFCEAIAGRLGWSVDVMRCVGYYYKWGNDLPALIKKERIPSRCARVLRDYYDSEMADIPQVKYRETAALVCADVILSTMIYLVNTDAALPKYDVIIDSIFERMHKKGTFDKCEITGKELNVIKNLFKEESYYYDTLRRE